MKIRLTWVLGIATLLILASSAFVFSQEQPTEEKVTPEAAEKPTEPETQWIWGEAVSVDALKKMLVVKYLDYETDQEKELTVNVDEKTSYDNVKSIDEIQATDSVSIDYIISPEGKNIATNISVEKPQAIPIPQEETAPVETEGEAGPPEE
jgi:hypothetical protein